MPRPALTPSDARRLLRQYQAGHLTQAAFCRKHDVSPSLFQYWLPKWQATAHPTPPAFEEVRLPSAPWPQPPCVLTLSSGARLEFPVSQLAAVLAVLTQEKVSC